MFEFICDHLGVNDVYIGRAYKAKSGRMLAASAWANPFKLRDCKDLPDCLAKFRAYLLSNAALLRRLPEVAGKRLVCHCRSAFFFLFF